jgi:hypothetical protein
MVLVRSGVTVALLPPSFMFFYLIFWSVQLYVAGPFDRCRPCPLRTPHGRARRGSLALGCR